MIIIKWFQLQRKLSIWKKHLRFAYKVQDAQIVFMAKQEIQIIKSQLEQIRLSTRTKSNLAYFCLFVAGITFVILVKDEPSDYKQAKQKTEYEPVKADSVYSTEHKAVFDYWIDIDSNRFKN